MGLADKLIAKHQENKARNIDEYGIPVPEDMDNRALCNYLCARAIVRNKDLYSRKIGGKSVLYNAHTPVACTISEVSYLCDWLEFLRAPMVRYIYNELLHLVPELDQSKIAITPNLLWDLENQELIKTNEPVRTVSTPRKGM